MNKKFWAILGILFLVACSSKANSSFQNTINGFNLPVVKMSSGIDVMDYGTLQIPDTTITCHVYAIPHGNDVMGAWICPGAQVTTSNTSTHVEYIHTSSGGGKH